MIFNGTDQSAVGDGEVSLTLADCESVLGRLNEVTVTRRVFRSGEGSISTRLRAG